MPYVKYGLSEEVLCDNNLSIESISSCDKFGISRYELNGDSIAFDIIGFPVSFAHPDIINKNVSKTNELITLLILFVFT